jgi:peptidoglycan/xylan/chitin deacetylase (PgdA/CDA1 family)
MNLNAVKRKAAVVFDALGALAVGRAVQRAAMFPYIRAVNYHDIPAEFVSRFEDHLRFYAGRFVDVDESALRGFLSGADWPHSKPGLIISFDDGLRSHSDVAAPLLEKYGFTGWFFVPADSVHAKNKTPGRSGHLGLSLEQLRYLDENHVVGCHTQTHCRLSDDLSDEKLRSEIMGGKRSLEEMLGHPVNIFCWVGGEEHTYCKRAADLVREGYDLAFMTNTAPVRPETDPLQIQRTNIEAENPLSLVRFQLSGIMDLLYAPKRRRVNRLTG